MNIAPIKYGLAYRIGRYVLKSNGDEILTSQICWESEPVHITADEALAAHNIDDEARTAKDEAVEFLRAALASDPRPAKDVTAEANARGITSKPLREARKTLGVVTAKDGMTGGWIWSLPKVPNQTEGAHV